jgi:exportin-T
LFRSGPIGSILKSKIVTQGRQAFILLPPNFTSLDKEARKEVDLNSLPLNVHGQMLLALIQSNISQYPHSAVLMQYFEAVARYGEFFKLRKECVPRVLEAFVTERSVLSEG